MRRSDLVGARRCAFQYECCYTLAGVKHAKRQDRLAFIVALGDRKQAPLIVNRQGIER
jgi:hypothetical protein